MQRQGWMEGGMKEEALTEKLIGVFYTVYNDLGHGFLEKIYQKAFALQLSKQGFNFEEQKGLRIHYLGVDLGEFYADLVVQSTVIVELKAAAALETAHELQLLNFLKASGIEVGLLLNFGPKPQVRRMIFDNEKKPALRSASAGNA
jgi:GxxExxY protein